MLTFPTIPADLSELDEDALGALIGECMSVVELVNAKRFTPSTPEDLEAFKATVEAVGSAKDPAPGTLRHELAAKVAAREEQERIFAAAAELLEDDGPDEAPGDDEPVDDGDDGDEDDVAVEVTAEPEVTAATVPARPKKGVGGSDSAPLNSDLGTAMVRANGGINGYQAGQPFESWTEFAAALHERAKTARGDDLRPVGYIKADYPKERQLGEDAMLNSVHLAKFEAAWGQGNDDELKAALCAPCTPYYTLSCMNTTRRPVFNSLPQFEAPRGCVSIYPSPSLSDITGGTGFWTHTDDANPSAVKNACQTIECEDVSTYYFYGVYRCLTVKNMLEMTYPELVEAYLNRLAARSARAAEVQLLDLMAAHASTITAPLLGFSAATTLPTQILHYLTAHRERERWDEDEAVMWAPRWLLNFIKIDIMRRRNTTGDVPSVPSDAEVNALFTGIGVTPNWFIDTPTWGVGFTAQPKINSDLVAMPTSVRVLLAPRGKFALIDRGQLNIGVTGNVVSRDLDQLSRNEFTYFFETFEGIVNTNSCPADVLRLPICASGTQTADDLASCDWRRDGAGVS